MLTSFPRMPDQCLGQVRIFVVSKHSLRRICLPLRWFLGEEEDKAYLLPYLESYIY